MMLGGFPASAQDEPAGIAGTVQDESGNPVEGAIVLVDGTWRYTYYMASSKLEDNEIKDLTYQDEDGNYYRDPYPSAEAAEMTTEADGAFEFDSLTPGEHYVFVRAEGFKLWREGPLDIAETEELSVTLTAWEEDDACRYPEGETTVFGGAITDAQTGEPVEGASVLIAGNCWSIRFEDGVLVDIIPMPRSNAAFSDAG
jgi:hypothetical protein